MKCRRITKDTDTKSIVWFGSYGKNQDGTAKFFNETDKHDNYSEDSEAVADSLTQELSVIEGELWYSIETGLPLLDKTQTKISMDAAISDIILSHQNVNQILFFESELINNNYSAYIIIESTFGTLELNI